ncbi:hypothetical protein V491_04816 [Pseudogymnoascus sp. VKM F-3775]|nr:hypothetical protein V491_04816 [Pseudogymnoascus sp. VKM F-3775]
MVRVGGRSRGCANCRQRKIKCNGEFPSCSQCVKRGKICPGAVQGNVFLVSSSKDDARRKKDRTVSETVFEPQNSSAGIIVPLEIESLQPSFGKLKETQLNQPLLPTYGAARRASPGHATPSSYDKYLPQLLSSQPCYVLLDRQRMCGRFIECLTKTPGAPMLKAWLPQLPDILSKRSAPTLMFALRAVSLALFGSLANNKTAQLEGIKWYKKGLQSQQKDLILLTNGAGASGVTDEAICGPTLLAFYEMTNCNTSTDAWMRHLCAASKLMEMRGPEACSSGFAYALFRALRLAMIYVTTDQRKPSFLATDLWRSVPFCETEKSTFDKLVDILIVIPSALSHLDAVATPGDDSTPQARDQVATKLLEIRRGLENWWTEYISELIQQAGLNSPLDTQVGNAHQTTSSRVTALYDDPFKAESRALYDTGVILVSHAQMLISPLLDSTTLREEIIAHSSSILRAVDYIERQEGHKPKPAAKPRRKCIDESLAEAPGDKYRLDLLEIMFKKLDEPIFPLTAATASDLEQGITYQQEPSSGNPSIHDTRGILPSRSTIYRNHSGLPKEPNNDQVMVIGWDGEEDPENPQNFGRARKWVIVIVLALSSTSVTCNSSLYSTTYTQITADFHVSELVATLGLSLFLLGMGIAPLFLGPLSEHFGRRPIYIGSLFFSLIWLLMCALSHNISTMLIGRFLGGLAGSAFLSVAGGTVGDMFRKVDLQAPMMIYSATQFMGPELGPLLGGFINEYTSWRNKADDLGAGASGSSSYGQR